MIEFSKENSYKNCQEVWNSKKNFRKGKEKMKIKRGFHVQTITNFNEFELYLKSGKKRLGNAKVQIFPGKRFKRFVLILNHITLIQNQISLI